MLALVSFVLFLHSEHRFSMKQSKTLSCVRAASATGRYFVTVGELAGCRLPHAALWEGKHSTGTVSSQWTASHRVPNPPPDGILLLSESECR
jgi:hypothetical protein